VWEKLAKKSSASRERFSIAETAREIALIAGAYLPAQFSTDADMWEDRNFQAIAFRGFAWQSPALNFAGSFADGTELNVAVKLFDR